MTYDLDLLHDLDSVKMHQHAKYLRQNSFSSKVTARTHAQTQHMQHTADQMYYTAVSAEAATKSITTQQESTRRMPQQRHINTVTNKYMHGYQQH